MGIEHCTTGEVVSTSIASSRPGVVSGLHHLALCTILKIDQVGYMHTSDMRVCHSLLLTVVHCRSTVLLDISI